MLKYSRFYVLLFVNFLASISIIPMALIGSKSENISYLIIPIYAIWFLLSLGSLILIIIMSAFHLKRAIAFLKSNDKLGLRIGMKRMKLASIPFFLANFLYFVLLALLLFVGSRGFVIFTPIPLLFLMAMGMTYVIMVCTSIYGFCYLLCLNKSHQITQGKLVLHLVTQLIFVLDIIDTMILVLRNRTPEEKITKKMVVWSSLFILFLLTLYILFSSGSLGKSNLWNGFYDNDQQIANSRMDEVLEAIKNKDKDGLKAMFSKKSIAQAENFDQSITDLFDYYQGDFVSYDDWGGPGVEEAMNEGGPGRNWKRMESTYDVKTSSGEYRFAIYDFVQDTTDEDNVGVWSLYIIRMEDDIDPEYAYWGDGKNTPGINIGLQWVPLP